MNRLIPALAGCVLAALALAQERLPAGKHTLELVFADSAHMPFNPPLYSQKITITVD